MEMAAVAVRVNTAQIPDTNSLPFEALRRMDPFTLSKPRPHTCAEPPKQQVIIKDFPAAFMSVP